MTVNPIRICLLEYGVMIIGDADIGPQMTYGLRGDLCLGFAHVFATKQELPVEVRDIDRVEVDLQVGELFKIN